MSVLLLFLVPAVFVFGGLAAAGLGDWLEARGSQDWFTRPRSWDGVYDDGSEV